MSTTKRQPKNASVTGCLFPLALIAIIIFTLGWNGKQTPLTTDDEMIARWQTEKSQWLELIETCERANTAYSLSSRYRASDKLISLASLDEFAGCELELEAPESADDFQYLAQSGKTSLLVTDRRRKGTGWIEEKASQWSGGWVSWKSAILEEKGFVYLTQAALEDTIAPLPIPAEITTESLDQFVGNYRGTSQISGNSSCELWKLRPIGSDVDESYIQSTWYLFYHQARECPS